LDQFDSETILKGKVLKHLVLDGLINLEIGFEEEMVGNSQ